VLRGEKSFNHPLRSRREEREEDLSLRCLLQRREIDLEGKLF
jgi:hypothetical protein